MNWQDILKLDDYVERKLKDLREALSRATPKDAKIIQEAIEYWESIKNG